MEDSAQVIKKDGTLEPFYPDKIERVVAAAGLNPHDAKILGDTVTEWIKINNKTKISTFEIRNKVIEELHKINEIVADFFIWYEKTKDEGLNN